MDELTKLIAQRKELDRRIKELQNPEYSVNGAKLYLKKYNTQRPDEWIVAIQEIDTTDTRPWTYRKIITAKTKEETMELLKSQIAALNALYLSVQKNTSDIDGFGVNGY